MNVLVGGNRQNRPLVSNSALSWACYFLEVYVFGKKRNVSQVKMFLRNVGSDRDSRDFESISGAIICSYWFSYDTLHSGLF